MAKLVSANEAKSYSYYNEKWECTNELFVHISYGADYVEIFVSSKSGDVADQIYDRLKSKEIFKRIKLLVLATYCITMDKGLIKDFFEHVEAIDVKTLKPGKVY